MVPKNEEIMAILNKRDDSLKANAEWKKPDTEEQSGYFYLYKVQKQAN